MTSDSKPARRAALSPLENLLLGAFGGSLETGLQMPLLSWKFSRQEGRPLPTTIAGWYRGVLAQTSSVAPITALQVMTNGILERLITGNKRESTDLEKIMTSCGAGVISAVIYTPVDLITIQQQKLAKGIGYTVRHVVNNYGITQGLYRGYASCALREGIYTCGYLGMAPVFTGYYKRNYPGLANKSEFLVSLTGALSAGLIAAAITHPADTSKTIIQADLDKKKYKTAIGTVFQLIREFGISGIFKGAIPRSMRLCGAFTIVSYCREKAIQWKTNRTSSHHH